VFAETAAWLPVAEADTPGEVEWVVTLTVLVI